MSYRSNHFSLGAPSIHCVNGLAPQTNKSVERLLLDDEAWLLSNSALMSSIIPPQSIELPLLILSAQSLEQIHQILEPLIKISSHMPHTPPTDSIWPYRRRKWTTFLELPYSYKETCMPITDKSNIRPSSNNVILQTFKKPVPAFCVLILNKGKGDGNYLLVAINSDHRQYYSLIFPCQESVVNT